MACFAAPAALGLITTLTRKKFPEKWHIDWLNMMVLGTVVSLGIDHIASGEIVPWPPFLTAMGSPETTDVMLREILAVGVPMTIALVLVWIGMVVIYERVLAAKKIQVPCS